MCSNGMNINCASVDVLDQLCIATHDTEVAILLSVSVRQSRLACADLREDGLNKL
jgi:hypothetical protein